MLRYCTRYLKSSPREIALASLFVGVTKSDENTMNVMQKENEATENAWPRR